MRNLYVTDLKRIFKDKLFIIACILAGLFAITNPIINKVLFELLDMGDLLDNLMNSKTIFFSAFVPGDNLGLIMPIFVSIIVCKDFSHGTVRNKIISGKSRVTIYFSHLFSVATVMCSLVLLHALLTLAVSLCFFPYQSTDFTAADFGYLMVSILFEMVVYIAISAITTFFATCAKGVGICILLSLAVPFGLSIVGAIFMVAAQFLDPSTVEFKVVEFINSLNIYTSSLIGAGTSYTAKQVIYILLSPVLITTGTTLIGVRRFSKKDLK